jgi:hypothetical protein
LPLEADRIALASLGSFNDSLCDELYSKPQEACHYYDDDHYTDDVKDIHCVLLRVRDEALLERPCAQRPT